MRTGRIAGTVGAVATLLAAGVVLAPATVLSIGPLDRAVTALANRDPRTVLLAAGAVAGLVALVVSRSASRRQAVGGEEPRRLVERPPESVSTEGPTIPGSTLDDRLADVAEGAVQPRAEVRETLRATAVRRLARVHGDPAAAREAVEAGTWTDDRLVAAFLGRETPPVSARLRAWLDPAGEHRRRVERTVRAVERLGERR